MGGDCKNSVDDNCLGVGVVTAISTDTGKCFDTCQTFVMAASDEKKRTSNVTAT